MSGASESPAPPDAGRAVGRRKPGIGCRVSILLGGALALVAGTVTGLHRLGYDEFAAFADIAALHGPLMVCGFFGTVISLERAVALRTAWAYAAPIAAGLGSIAMIAGGNVMIGQAAWLVAGILLAAMSLVIAVRHPALFTTTLFLGATAWAAGTLLWAAGAPLPNVILWWVAFLVLTIAAERLELSRLIRQTPAAQLAFVACLALLVAAACLGTADSAMAWPASGAALIGLSAWLFRNDVARRTIRIPGLPRYAAACLLGGYAWLGIAGALAIGFPVVADPPIYDAVLHAIFLGFVFAMVFGHAPIILPAIARCRFRSLLISMPRSCCSTFRLRCASAAILPTSSS